MLESLVQDASLARSVEVGRKRYRITESASEEASLALRGARMAEALGRRHFEWYANLAMWAGPELFSSERGNWLDLLKLELPNLLAALRWSLAKAPEDGRTMAGSLRPLWNHTLVDDAAGEGRDLFMKLLGSGEVSSETKKTALEFASRSAQVSHNAEEAASYLRENLEIAREIADGRLLSAALLGSSDAAAIEGDNSSALRLAEEARAHAEAAGDQEITAEALMRMGNFLRARGEYTGASEMLERSLKIFRELNDAEKIETLLHAMGSLRVLQGDYSGAISLLEERREE
ncbi:MAG: tetratricopeptide repeat protein [Acidimicrobiia bacterium]